MTASLFIGTLLFLIALAELIIGLRFLFRYQRSASTTFYGLFCLGVAVYVGANGFGYLTGNVFIGDRVGWAGGALTAAFFLPFSYSFPIQKKSYSELFPWVVWPFLIFFLGTLFSDLFFKTTEGDFKTGYQTATGPYFWFYLLFFFCYWGLALVNLARSYRFSDGIHRWQIRMILIGIIVSLSVSSVFDIMLPLFTVSHFGYIGSLMTSAWLGVTAYILVRR